MSIKLRFVLLLIIFNSIIGYSQEEVEKQSVRFYAGFSYSLQYSQQDEESWLAVASNNDKISFLGGRLQSTILSGGVNFQNLKVGPSLAYHSNKSYLDYSSYYPLVPFVSHRFEMVYSWLSAGLYLGYQVNLNDYSFFEVGGGVAYSTFKGKNSEMEYSDLYREDVRDTVTLITTYVVQPSSGKIQVNLGASINSVTAIGTFGFGVDWSILPIHYADGRLAIATTFKAFQGYILGRSYLGFNIRYQWSKSKQ